MCIVVHLEMAQRPPARAGESPVGVAARIDFGSTYETSGEEPFGPPTFGFANAPPMVTKEAATQSNDLHSQPSFSTIPDTPFCALERCLTNSSSLTSRLFCLFEIVAPGMGPHFFLRPFRNLVGKATTQCTGTWSKDNPKTWFSAEFSITRKELVLRTSSYELTPAHGEESKRARICTRS
jgi:hypothetical protein